MDRSTKIAWAITGSAILAYLLLRKSTDGGSVLNTTKTYNPEYDMRLNDNLPRGYYNNNPLNIRISKDQWQGKVTPNTDGAFEQFIDMAHGYRAALIILRNYIKKYNCNTLRKIITRWAPPSENNTESYIKNVSRLSGVGENEIIAPTDKERLVKIAYAMSISENGYKDKAQQDIKQRYDLPNMEIINEGWRLI